MRRFGKQVGIFADSMVVGFFDAADKVGRDLAIANLSGADLAEDTEIAQTTGVVVVPYPPALLGARQGRRCHRGAVSRP
jgi:hypothetical protein